MKNIEKYMLLLTLAGALLSFYLYYTDVVNIPAICPNDGCAKVASSEYSRFLGVHVSLWGLLYYIGFSLIFFFKDSIELVKKNFKLLNTLALVVGLGFTIYLRIVEFVFIKAICIWCWGSVVIVVLLTILYFLNFRSNVKEQETNEY